MNRFAKTVTAVALGASSLAGFASSADARTRHHRHHYYGSTAYHRCRYSSGGTGLIVGGVAGAVAGPSIIGHGLLGAAAGAVGGAVAGRAIDRTATAHRRCR
jgi:hypothetical protein